MAENFHLRLLGGFRLTDGGGAVIPAPWRKGAALLAYLGATIGTPCDRDRLAFLLWGQSEQRLARQSLRQMLHTLDQELSDGQARLLHLEGQTVALAAGRVHVDAAEFESLVSRDDVACLAKGVDLYTGEFLAGLNTDSPDFEEWLEQTRSRYRDLALRGLITLAAHQQAMGELDLATESARRALRIDPFREDIHRNLMRLHAAHGLCGAALIQYRECERVLRRELGVSPDAATLKLHEAIAARCAAPVVAVAAGRVSAVTVKPAVAKRPLIGRDGQLADLHQCLDQIAGTGARLVVVTGEAGVGKSALLHDFLRNLGIDRVAALVIHAHVTERNLAFALWARLLNSRSLRAEDAPVPSRSLARRLAFVHSGLHKRDRRHRTAADDLQVFDAVVEYLRDRGADTTLVLAFEDLHVADAASLRLLSYVIRNLRRTPVLILATMRSEERVGRQPLADVLHDLEREGLLDRISLQPLSQAETSALVGTMWQDVDARMVPRSRLREVWALSDGNPGIVVEAAQALDGSAPGTVPLDLPGVLRADYTGRLEGLDDTARLLAATASVIGKPCTAALLACTAQVEQDAALRGIESLVAAGLFAMQGDDLGFARGRYRLAQYRSLLDPRRRQLHQAAARAIAKSSADAPAARYAALAHHYGKAGEADKALQSELRLGNVQRRQGAYAVARRSYRRVLKAMARRVDGPDTRHCEMESALGLALADEIAGDVDGALAVLYAREKHSGDRASPELRARLLYALGRLNGAQGNGETAYHYTRRAVGEARENEGCLWQPVDRLLESIHLLGAIESAALDVVAKSRQRAWRHKLLADEADLATVHALLLAFHGHAAPAQTEARAAVAAAKRLGDSGLLAVATQVRGIVQDWCGDSRAALVSFADALDLVHRNGDLLRLYSVRGHRGSALARAGRFSEAVDELDEALRMADRLDVCFSRSLFRAWKVGALAKTGNVISALQEGRETLHVAAAANRPWAHSMALRGLAQAMANTEVGDTAGAKRAIRAALAEQEAAGFGTERALSLAAYAGILRAAGDTQRSNDLAKQADT